MATTINVKIAPLPRGEWDNGTAYAKLDAVSYNGSSYMAIKAVPTGTVPTNTTYWQLLAEKPTIGEGSITTDMLADGAVTADKLDSSVSETYAEVSGTYEDMVVGSAEQLLSTQYDTDSVPYAFRKSPYGDREFDEIVGGSIAWNQLIQKGNMTDGWTFSNSTGSYSNNVLTFTASAQNGFVRPSLSQSIISGHKYYGTIDIKGTSAFTANVFFDGRGEGTMPASITTSWASFGKIFANTVTESNYYPRVFDTRASGWDAIQIRNCMLIDLTQMFGIAVADYIYSLETNHTGDGVAFFRSLFPKSYYAYNTGTLIHSNPTSKVTTGFNQWDEEWEVGLIDGTTGQNSSGSGSIRAKNYIPVLPNTTYYFYCGAGKSNNPYCYDANKNYLGRLGTYVVNQTFITPVNCHYLRFAMPGTYGGTYLNDICINFSGDKNGIYEPYSSHTYPLSSGVLRGVPKLVSNKLKFDGDVYSSDGSVQRRYGIVTLNGSESWGMNVTSHNGYVSMNSVKRVSDYRLSMISSYLPVDNQAGDTSTSAMASWVSAYYNNGTNVGKNWIYVHIDGITTAADLKAYLANKPLTLVYELASPTTESASPYVNPQYCNEYGTEQFVTTEQSGVAMITGHISKYFANLRKKIEGLPWNFSSLIAPTEVTNKATRNYTVGSFLIMNNTLYKVTSAIANGGTITVGSNVSATTIMQEILAL